MHMHPIAAINHSGGPHVSTTRVIDKGFVSCTAGVLFLVLGRLQPRG